MKVLVFPALLAIAIITGPPKPATSAAKAAQVAAVTNPSSSPETPGSAAAPLPKAPLTQSASAR